MSKPTGIRTTLLAIHGVLALALGLVLLYLRGTMTNVFFEALAIVFSVMLASAALILAAITDWFVAFGSGMRSAHRIIFYILGGIALVLIGLSLAYFPAVHLQWLVVLAVVHALAFGISAFAFAFNAEHLPFERNAMRILGAISVILSGAMAGWLDHLDDRMAVSLLGLYSCFVGIKILFFAWSARPGVESPPQTSSKPREELALNDSSL